MSERLYIIGNGFDRYHGAPSSYYDFRTYLTHHNVDIIKTFDLYFGPRSLVWTLAHPILFDWYFGDFPDFHLPIPKNEWSMKWRFSVYSKRDEQNVKRLVKRLNLPIAENVQTFSLQPKS